MPRVGLLVCDHVSPEFLHVAGDYTDMFRRLFAPHPDIDLLIYDLPAGQFPSSPEECDGWITTGSRHSVYDGVGWIGRLEELVRAIASTDRRFVGVCFGHQMIAQALGGEVQRATAGWGVGTKEVDVLEPPPWLARNKYRILNSHADQVTRPPSGAVVLGGNDHCAISLMARGETMIGIQGHPEFVSAYSEALIRVRRGVVIPVDVGDAGLDSLEVDPDTDLLADALATFLRGG